MRKIVSAVALTGVSLALVVSAAFAAKNMNQTVMLHAPMHTKMMAIAHATGSARIAYSAQDVNVNLTAHRLPAPATIHESVYTLWLVRGSHKVMAGHFTPRNGTGTLHAAMIMDTTFTKLVVTGEKSMTGARPMGPVVLSGAVMHH